MSKVEVRKIPYDQGEEWGEIVDWCGGIIHTSTDFETGLCDDCWFDLQTADGKTIRIDNEEWIVKTDLGFHAFEEADQVIDFLLAKVKRQAQEIEKLKSDLINIEPTLQNAFDHCDECGGRRTVEGGEWDERLGCPQCSPIGRLLDFIAKEETP